MRVALAYAASLDGKITNHEDLGPPAWASDEDGELLGELISAFEAVIIGREVYEQLHPGIYNDRLYVVMTHNPERFKKDTVVGKREFSDMSPKQLIKRLEGRVYQNVLLLTGNDLSTQFLKAGLVDDLYLTIEPRLFGAGRPMVTDVPLNIEAQLESVNRLNERGTLFAHYMLQK